MINKKIKEFKLNGYYLDNNSDVVRLIYILPNNKGIFIGNNDSHCLSINLRHVDRFTGWYELHPDNCPEEDWASMESIQ